MQVSLVDPRLLYSCWGTVSPLLERAVALSGGRFTVDDVFWQIVRQQQHLWVAMDGSEIVAAVTTGKKEYPRKNVMCIFFCGGDRLEEWLSDMLDILERWAKDNDCQSMEIVGRFGWKPALLKRGWKTDAMFFERDLDVEGFRQADNDGDQ